MLTLIYNSRYKYMKVFQKSYIRETTLTSLEIVAVRRPRK